MEQDNVVAVVASRDIYPRNEGGASFSWVSLGVLLAMARRRSLATGHGDSPENVAEYSLVHTDTTRLATSAACCVTSIHPRPPPVHNIFLFSSNLVIAFFFSLASLLFHYFSPLHFVLLPLLTRPSLGRSAAAV